MSSNGQEKLYAASTILKGSGSSSNMSSSSIRLSRRMWTGAGWGWQTCPTKARRPGGWQREQWEEIWCRQREIPGFRASLHLLSLLRRVIIVNPSNRLLFCFCVPWRKKASLLPNQITSLAPSPAPFPPYQREKEGGKDREREGEGKREEEKISLLRIWCLRSEKFWALQVPTRNGILWM